MVYKIAVWVKPRRKSHASVASLQYSEKDSSGRIIEDRRTSPNISY